MDWPRQCAAIIPCFNEAAKIQSVVTRIKKFLPHVIVVDDGSADTTASLAKNSGATVLSLKRNSGKGSALRAGWNLAREMNFTWTLMLDGDGQHCADDAQKFFDCAEKTGAKLVVGNRMDSCEAMPWLRRTVNSWMSHRLSALTGKFLPDSQCGYRLTHLDTLSKLPLAANRFEIESEMLVAFLAAQEKIQFVPIRTIYESRASHISPLADSTRWLRWRFAQTSSPS